MRLLNNVRLITRVYGSALIPAGATSEESGESKDKDVGLYINFKFIMYS